jgi:DNA-binding PadR family transcriptional regulator
MKKQRVKLIDDLGRFSEPALLILISLAEAPKHGYEMMLDIEQVSGSRLGPGTLYGGIARLEERGWIQPLPVDDRRRPYTLTTAGKRVLSARLESLKVMARVGEGRLAKLRPATP